MKWGDPVVDFPLTTITLHGNHPGFVNCLTKWAFALFPWSFLQSISLYQNISLWWPMHQKHVSPTVSQCQGGITCGAIDEPRKSSKAIDERVIINFCDKNVVIARFCDKNVVIARFSWQIYLNFYHRMGILPLKKCVNCDKCDKTAYVWGLRYRWDPSLSRNPVPRFPHFMPPWLWASISWSR